MLETTVKYSHTSRNLWNWLYPVDFPYSAAGVPWYAQSQIIMMPPESAKFIILSWRAPTVLSLHGSLVTPVLLGADCSWKNEPGSLLWAVLSLGCSLRHRGEEICASLCLWQKQAVPRFSGILWPLVITGLDVHRASAVHPLLRIWLAQDRWQCCATLPPPSQAYQYKQSGWDKPGKTSVERSGP